MKNEKSRLTAATVNPANERIRNCDKDTKYLRDDYALFQKYLSDYNFNIHEQMPDIFEALARERRIAETRQNPSVRAAMMRNINLFLFAFGQMLDEIELLRHQDRNQLPLYFDPKRKMITTIKIN
jgi:hypothetical protein